MENGVYFQDPNSTYIDKSVEIASGSRILANCHLTGKTSIEKDCVIGPNSIINDSKIGEGSLVQFSVIDEAEIKGKATIGPYAHLRKGSILDENVKVGAFAETKIQKLEKAVKYLILLMLEMQNLEEDVNFSAGAITVIMTVKKNIKLR